MRTHQAPPRKTIAAAESRSEQAATPLKLDERQHQVLQHHQQFPVLSTRLTSGSSHISTICHLHHWVPPTALSPTAERPVVNEPRFQSCGFEMVSSGSLFFFFFFAIF